jgi:hypothetical protein
VSGEARRRWVNEQQVLAEMERLADLSMETVADYAVHSAEAARAEAAYKSLRARKVLTYRAASTSSRPSIAEAENAADADDEVAAAYLLRLTTAAAADTDREALRSIRANLEALRTAAASAREGVRGPGWGG